jgi:hypothetical protein
MSAMTISGSAGTYSPAAKPAVSSAAAASATTAAAATKKTAKGHGHHGEHGGVSKDAEMMKQLQELQKTDPEKLKQVASDVADKLKAAADKQGGDAGKALSALADKFSAVAKTGDLSALQPAGKPGAAKGSAPPTGAAAYSQNAQKAPLGVDVKQIVEDALKTASKAAA